jgi:hypothetical protein
LYSSTEAPVSILRGIETGAFCGCADTAESAAKPVAERKRAGVLPQAAGITLMIGTFLDTGWMFLQGAAAIPIPHALCL